MSRTMSILLGMGLASLALVGCSKNNIAGPQPLKAVALDQDRPSQESDSWKGHIYVDLRAVSQVPAGADYSTMGRPAVKSNSLVADEAYIQ